MRDADLLVAVAQAAGDAQLSAEGYQRRAELVANLLADLAVPGVTLEGHYAAVQGRRAGYRVHLASGAVYIGPTHHLCIVPDHVGEQPDNIYLPFLDEGNPKLVEIISKILFLANDQAIRDPSILAQIATANAAQGR